MTTVEVAQLVLGWLALLAVAAAVIWPRLSRWCWAAAALLGCAWLAVTQSAPLALALAVATLLGVAAEGAGETIVPEFNRLTRCLGLLVGALLATVVVLVRLAHVDAMQAPVVFPVVAIAVISLVILFAALDPAEMYRAARLLLLMAAVGWTVATTGSQPASVLMTSAVLPLLGLMGRSAGHAPEAAGG
jgi:hypothetical protein